MYCFSNIIFRCTAYAPAANFLSLIRIARLAIVKKPMNWDPNCGNYSLILRKNHTSTKYFFDELRRMCRFG